MEYTKLGNTGLTVSRICLGCMSYGEGNWRAWTLDRKASREHFELALNAGITFFDTADIYSNGSSEEITGHWLGEMADRDDVVIATKLHGPMGAGHNRQGLSRSCRRLPTSADSRSRWISGHAAAPRLAGMPRPTPAATACCASA